MVNCTYCNVAVDSQHAHCPLCDRRLDYGGDSITVYPSYQKSYQLIKAFTIYKLYLFITIAAIIVSVTINLLMLPASRIPWSAFVAVPLLYVWLTIQTFVVSKMHIGGKILLQFVSSAVVAFLIDLYFDFTKWSTNYVVPFLIVLSTMILTALALTKKSYWIDYLSFLYATFFISLCPIVLFFFKLANVLWPSVAAILYALLTILGLLIFANRRFKDETKKKFHF